MQTVEQQLYRLNIGDYYSAILEDGHPSFVFGFSECASFLLDETVSYAMESLSLNSDRFKGHHYTVVVYRRDSFNGNRSSVIYSRSIN